MTGRQIDFGLEGRTAIVCASSAGLGYACAEALAIAGATVVINGRDAAKLAAAADRITAVSGVRPAMVVADVTTPEGRAALLAAAGDVDILVNNAGGPPPGDFRQFDDAAWHKAFNDNALTAIHLISGVLDGMKARRWGRIINITSGAVKAPIAALPLSNAARSGLTGFVAGLAREVAAHGITINNLLPGLFDTDRFQTIVRLRAERDGCSLDAARAKIDSENPTGRVGQPRELGWWCAFFASEQGGYANGQNLMLDGGSFPGTF